MSGDQDTGMEVLAEALFYRRANIFKTPPNERGEFAIFPKAAKSEADWERRCQEMHSSQVPVELAAKPADNSFARPYATRNSQEDQKIMNYHDLPEHLRRGN